MAHRYTSLSLHPAHPENDRVGSPRHIIWECWGAYTEVHPQMGAFETDGIVGWLYDVIGGWVWLNEAGHPTYTFPNPAALEDWLKTLAPEVTWHPEPR